MNAPLVAGATTLTLFDLVVLGLVAAAVLAGLRRGGGALAAVLVGLVATVGCWLVAGLALAWADGPVRHSVARSAFVHLVAPPTLDRPGPGPR